MSVIRLDSRHGEIRSGTQADIQLCRLPVQPEEVQGQAHSGMLADLKFVNSKAAHRPFLLVQTTYVPNRPFDRYRETGPLRSAPHETNSVAPEKSMEDPRITRKGDPDPKISPYTFKIVAPSNKQMSFKVSHYTLSVILFRSLQMPQEKAGALA